jgi:hypothetical protein
MIKRRAGAVFNTGLPFSFFCEVPGRNTISKQHTIMNKLTRLIILSFIFFGASLSASAQIYVTVRPATPVIVMTAQPSPEYIWIGEEWIADGPNYKHVGGYWSKPPRQGYKWKKGYWSNKKGHGHHWVNGGWYGKKGKG